MAHRRYVSPRKYRGYRGGYRGSYNYGTERALQHIREAEELSHQLGGTDKDVKEYFFSLPPSQLRGVLDAYERAYGRSKREYAEQALPEWRSGRRHVSGLVASRLFDLLPPRMPLEKKYELVKNLWQKMGPRSHKALRIGPDATVEEIIAKTRDHVMETVRSYTIPESLEQRFKWLSMGDVKVQQELMNRLLDMEKQQAVELTRLQIPMMLEHIRNKADYTHRLAQVLEIGNHKYEMLYDKTALGIALEAPGPLSPSSAKDMSWVFWLILGLMILYFLYFLSK